VTHPILADPRRLRVFLTIWIPLGLMLSVLPYWWSGGRLADAWPVAMWAELFAVPLLASWYVCRFSTIDASASRILATVITAAIVTTGLWIGIGRLWFNTIAPLVPAPDVVFARFHPLAFAGGALAFVGMCAVNYALSAADEGRVAAQRALHADIAARDAELRALRSQVNPHFLFNCLHSISALVPSDPEGARRMCLELADFFRDSLRAGSRPRVPMDTEAALVRRYLDIERVRFGDRLQVDISLDPEAADALVPPLLLQPLAENAVRHGIATIVDGGAISIAIAREGDRIHMRVDNAFDPDGRRPGTGMGLTNVRARLETSFGDRAYMRVDATDSRFRVSISLPRETATGEAVSGRAEVERPV
jgi:two-component system, LytTR family, sensor histidine kinase AlgZ